MKSAHEKACALKGYFVMMIPFVGNCKFSSQWFLFQVSVLTIDQSMYCAAIINLLLGGI
jgi:hypothetical protein